MKINLQVEIDTESQQDVEVVAELVEVLKEISQRLDNDD